MLVFDGECRFCALWIRRWQQITGDAVDYAPFQSAEVAGRFPEIPREQCASAVQLIEADGRVHSGARAALEALGRNSAWRWLPLCYQRSSRFANIAEAGYCFVAAHRDWFSWLTRLGWGGHVEQPSYFLVRRWFLRGLALIYLVAFASLWSQIDGLLGSNGILPAESFMAEAREQATAYQVGLDRYRLLPTWCWLNASEASLHWQCGAGVGLAILLLLGVAPLPCLVLLWSLYLSLTVVGQEFFSFQWDSLLLETGLLAIFFAPLQLWPRRERERQPSRIVLWLLRLLLFKLMFQSGCVKWLSGDPLWRQLTALTVHYETQPLPTWLGWYAHQLPVWFQKLSCLAMFAIELLVPFLVFAPRRPRMAAASLLAMLQVLILLTGNYTYFNWLTLLLCVPLLDDFALRRVVGRSRAGGNAEKSAATMRVAAGDTGTMHWRRRVVTIPLAVTIVAVTGLQMLALFRVRAPWLSPVASVQHWLAPLRSVNNYGLFAVVTSSRQEIIMEGSNDGVVWLPYEFKYKPGDLKRRPAFVAPHQPRLDWQMWFAALGQRQNHPWFGKFCLRLLQGSPEVLALLETNPFPAHPPRLLRARIYHYRFTDFAERHRTGYWWWRDHPREYLPAVALPVPN